MKESGTIMMAGERMHLTLSAKCISVCTGKEALHLPQTIGRIAKLLKRHDVARCFIRDIRIGETAALVDKSTGLSFRVQMQEHNVCILEICKWPKVPQETMDNVIFLTPTAMLRAVAGRAA